LIGFIKKQKSTNFLVYSWGQDLNNLENQKTFKKDFDGIIYDRIYEKNHVIDIKLIFNHRDFAENNFDPTHDSVFITGSNEALGNWNINRALKLTRKIRNNDSDEWTTSIDIEDKKFEYKYLIAREPTKHANELIVKRLDLNKRIFDGNSLVCVDTWHSDSRQLVKGWLLKNQFEIQFNFYSCPLKLFPEISHNSIKITPVLINKNGKWENIDEYIYDFTVRILQYFSLR
jgi:hypothetical protein